KQGEAHQKEEERFPPTDCSRSGITHLWLSGLDSHLSRPAAAAVRNLNLPGLNLKTPLPTAEKRLLAAAGQQSWHFWTHCWLGVALERAGKLEEAELAFNCCVALRPEYATGYRFRSSTILAQARRA